MLSRHHLRRHEEPVIDAVPAVPTGAVLVAMDATPSAEIVLETAGRVARSRGVPVHHEDAANAVLGLAERILPVAIVVGRPGRHGGELGAPSLTTLLTERAPCDVVVVAGAARRVPVLA